MTDRITTGGDIDSYCTRCRLKLEHIIIAMVGGTVVKVRCKTCGSIHRFRGMPAASAASSGKKGPAQKSFATSQGLWETAMGEAKGPELSYNMEESYSPGDLIVHGVFGKGVVQKTLFRKCAVLFRDRERLLVTANT